jgi:phosphoglycerate kinase
LSTWSIPKLPTLSDLNLREKRVFMRIDVNVPIDPEEGKILDDRRIRVHAQFIRKIVDEYNPALVLGSHQGRPGSQDFTTLEQHAELLAKYSGLSVKYVDDVIGPTAIDEMRSLKPGEVLLLNNLRLASEEIIEGPPERQALTIFAKRIASAVEHYVNDAFATAHRSQPSIVGLPLLLPSAIGPVFEKEMEALSKAISASEPPRVYVLGGKKVIELLRVIETLVRNKAADRILTGGLLAQLFLLAKGVNIGQENIKVLEENGILPYVPRARYLLMRGAPIETPVDFLVKTKESKESTESSKNVYLGSISGVIMDIGEQTAKIYEDLLREAKVIVLRGPMGVIEEESYRRGTLRVLEASMQSKGFVLVAGGHLASMMSSEWENSSKVHVSLGGNATLLFLSGEELPAIKAMELSAKMFFGW